MAKDFTKKAQGMQSVYQEMMPEEVQHAQDAQERLDTLRTQGVQGLKSMRINMAFTPANSDFIRVMAAIHGQSMTQYVNSVIEAERERNGDKYKKAKALVDDQ